MPSACDTLSTEQTSQEIKSKKSKQNKKNGSIKKDNGQENGNLNEIETVEKVNGTIDQNKAEDSSQLDKTKNDQELIFIHETGFNIKISCPGIETFDLQVCTN